MSQTPDQPPPTPVVNYATPAAATPKSFHRGILGWVLFIGLAITLFLVLQSNKPASTEIPLSQFVMELDRGNVRDVAVEGDTLRGHFSGPVNVGGTTTVTS